ncbi:MAG: hypothetical protein PHP93_01765 [Kiritimatiellales bacterium]|nr:hypothetical protein [Kiritimatiellales bacterium]
MKKTGILMMAAALVAGVVNAADVSLSGDFASAYVFRGVTLNKGLVFQPGAEVSGFPIPEEYGSVAVGVWGNYDIDDSDGAVAGSSFSEIDYYVSYTLPVTVVDLSVTYTYYDYPNGGTADEEIAFSVGKGLGETGLYASLTANYGVGGAVDGSWYIQAALDYEKELSEKLSMSAGVNMAYALVDGGSDGFNDAGASVGLSYALNDNWSLNGSLNYVAQLDDNVLSDASYDVPVYATLGVSCDF